MSNYQVAVIVYTYNSDLKKTLVSVKSAIYQSDIKHQIIIADDGSVNNNKSEIENLFHESNYSDYSFNILESNKGITENLRQASELVDAEYIKILSPGDYLSDSNTLAKLYNFAKNGNYKVCFGDAIYYRDQNDLAVPLKRHTNAPKSLYPYNSNNIKAQLIDCLVLNDFILGAAVFTETVTYKKYINKIAGHVRYFEDNALRLMIYDGIAVRHFPEVIMWYECGNGISTSNSKYWLDQLEKDYFSANKLILNSNTKNSFIRARIKTAYSKKMFFYSTIIFFPEVIPQLIINIIFPRKIIYNKPSTFIKKLIKISENTNDEKN